MLLEQKSYTTQVVIKIFIPYLFYMLVSLSYMSLWVPITICDSLTCIDNDGSTSGIWMRTFMLLFGSLFITIELI